MFLLDPYFWLNLGIIGLAIIAFIESIFFPLPPDVILIPLALADRNTAFFYAFIATLFSSLGSVGGCYIGKHAGQKLMNKLVSKRQYELVKKIYTQHGALALLLAALTPIPYKIFTILSGTFGLDWKVVFVLSVIGRGARFFAEGALVYLYGEMAVALLTSNIEIATITIGACILVVYLAYIYIKKRLK